MQTIINNLINISISAGRKIIEIYNSDFSFEMKSDDSPLTLADRESHRIITEGLKRYFPDILVMSEEGVNIPCDLRKDHEYYFLVDPLDGTKEFIKRNGEFTVNIALIERDRPLAGVIFIPVKKTIYYAMRNSGAYKLNLRSDNPANLSEEEIMASSSRLPLYNRGNDRESIVVAGSRSHKSEEFDAFIESLRVRYRDIEFITAGSSLKFCLIAEELADIYPRFGTTMEWDTAAGQIIVEESGGVVSDIKTLEPLRYNKEDLKNPWFIAINGSKKGYIRLI